MKTRIILIICLITGIAVHLSANEKIYINREVTTHIVMPENIKMVDISTTKIIGNQCTDNIVRIKPYLENDSISSEGYSENELLGTLTIIGERHIAQYDILYTESPDCASTIYNVSYNETQSYINPEVSMPMAEIARYAWAVYGSRRKFNQIVSDKNGIRAYINNIYSIGDYFFLDYTLKNRTRIAYDIEEIRVKLTDKKETKATNSQMVELHPVFTLEQTKRFRYGYRNVIVIRKMTFPNDKQLTIEMTENQISGRTISLKVNYSDVLSADSFNPIFLK